jgi:hypothetical protein
MCIVISVVLRHTEASMRPLALLLLPILATTLSAQAPIAIPPVAEQVGKAVLPLPVEFRASATVLGYNADGKLVTLRQGSGAMICLADDPKQEPFHAACYQKELEPFMARGRSLRAEGVKGPQVDTVRFREIAQGKIKMPKTGALWQLTGPHTGIDLAAGTVSKEVRALYVIYIPGATPESTGIPTAGAQGSPWLMFPGTPKAHIMFVPTM